MRLCVQRHPLFGGVRNEGRGTSARILLVEDFKPHRLMITSLLTRNPNLNVVGEAEDGMQPTERFAIFNLVITYLCAEEAVDGTNTPQPVKYGKFLNK